MRYVFGCNAVSFPTAAAGACTHRCPFISPMPDNWFRSIGLAVLREAAIVFYWPLFVYVSLRAKKNYKTTGQKLSTLE